MMMNTSINIKILKDYFDIQISVAESGLSYWKRCKGDEEYELMIKYWNTVKDTLIQIKKDLIGFDSVVLQSAGSPKRSLIVRHTDFKDGTIEHLNHYKVEFQRIEELYINSTGELKNLLEMELDGIRIILESYNV